MTTLRSIPSVTKAAQKATRTRTDTIQITPTKIDSWKPAPFQRPLSVNAKVLALSEEIKTNDGVIPGVITLGQMDGQTYLLDGQHRIHAFVLSELAEGFADVRICEFQNLGEMGQEFVNTNSRLVNFKPDDILRGLESANPPLQKIREKCPYIGYGYIRRSAHSPILSMSLALRSWFGSFSETPSGTSTSTINLANQMTMDEADNIVTYIGICYKAWGKDPEYSKLWGALNLTVTAWLYRRTVITPYSASTPKLTKEQFTRGLMRVSASSDYTDWLKGRLLNDRERSPCYQRIKALLAKSVEEDTGSKIRLPQPVWSGGK